ncbi:MAG: hypothetical protein ABEK36_06120, partial [Candidatus Aenigmatarchaeota archaeon]
GDPSRGLVTIEPVNMNHQNEMLKMPEDIKIYLTGENRIVEVDFKEYCKNVLPNEWIGSWDNESGTGRRWINIPTKNLMLKILPQIKIMNPIATIGKQTRP